MSSRPPAERNQDATVYCGDLDPQVDEELLMELFIQVAPVNNVFIPKDRVTGQHSGFGFVEFRSPEDVDYAVQIMNAIRVFGRSIRVNKSSNSKHQVRPGPRARDAPKGPPLAAAQRFALRLTAANVHPARLVRLSNRPAALPSGLARTHRTSAPTCLSATWTATATRRCSATRLAPLAR